MKTESQRTDSWCTGAFSRDAPTHQNQSSLKELAKIRLAGDQSGASGALGARGASGAGDQNTVSTDAILVRLFDLADSLGIPRGVVDQLPQEELLAAASQVSACRNCRDGCGDPLAHSLLTFWLRSLADQASDAEHHPQ